ncbi:SDR family NAD(P)-dependent oxidoreductase [Cohnella faecalis]|uniref:SDR family oxidoreductase n=1 Tax=Cohnella faecalis TaxID=2315694 RepID=A0A398CB35_9BACL|nr:glucose 1-dehydrogenase [Cohnella faecalis]RIE00356.1 SDR family oxidoreductase [Cohnella faecalis]
MRLQGKICLITGSGSGIGRSTAVRFAEEGAVVIVNDLNDRDGNETVAEIRSNGGEAFYYGANVTEPDKVEAMVADIIAVHGRIDVLFNNAGISGVGKLHETELAQWERVLQVNVIGVYIVSKAVLPHMMERRNGSIINMSSCIAEIGLAQRAPYAASKGAVLSLTKSMQVDYAPYHIRVNALLPGTILTPFVERYLKESYEDPEAGYRSLKARQLSGDLGRPSDVAQAAVFLASDESTFVMGSPFYVDGGATFGKNA